MPTGVQGYPECPVPDPSGFPDPKTPIMALNLPAGDYLVLASMQIYNHANFLFQNNSRIVNCALSRTQSFFGAEAIRYVELDGFGEPNHISPISLHVPVRFQSPGTLYIVCGIGNGSVTERENVQVFVPQGNLTAIRVGSLSEQ
jgi:hypothetical protein